MKISLDKMLQQLVFPLQFKNRRQVLLRFKERFTLTFTVPEHRVNDRY